MNFDKYNIVINPSAEMFKQTLVVMLSAILNCKKKCHFFIMQFDWTKQQKEYLYNFIESYPGNKVEFIDVNDDLLNQLRLWKGYHTTYYKTIAHLYLSDKLERILYLDVDTIVCKDIYNYYSMDFDDNYIIGSAIYPSKEIFEERHKFENAHNPGFVNGGVLLLNLTKLRNDNISVDMYADSMKNRKNYLADQGMISCFFYDKIKLLPGYKYNHVLVNEGGDCSYDKIHSMSKEERMSKLCPAYWEEEIDDSENETIVHFAGGVSKPWGCIYTAYDGKVNIKIPILRNNVPQKAVEHLYFKWWEIARQLPFPIYEEFLNDSYKISMQPVVSRLKWVRNALSFFESLGYDNISNFRFANYMYSLNGKKISIIKAGSLAGKYVNKFAASNNIKILFEADQGFLTNLTPEEWNKCKQADVIINCDVHGAKPIARDGIEPIMIWDILKNDSLLSPENRFDLAISNNKLLTEFDTAKSEISGQISQISEQLAEFNEMKKENDKLSTENKKLSEEKTEAIAESSIIKENIRELKTQFLSLNAENTALNERIHNLTTENSLLSSRSENQIQNLAEELNDIVLQRNDLKEQAEIQANEIRLLTQKLADIQASHSWRITKPFRSLKAIFTKK